VTKDGWYLDDIGIFVYTIVPVELSSFTAEESDGKIFLTWVTSTELNNQKFIVEKRDAESVWKNIGEVAGYGTTTEVQHYSFIDDNVSSGKLEYRLKQIDYDGSYRIYGPIKIEFTGNLIFSLEQNYPNPFNPATTINFSIPQTGLVSLKIYDLLGKEIKTLVNEIREAGFHQVIFDASDFSSGVYFYTIKADDFVQTKKLTLIK
jgi:uncharacterized membrane protein